MSASPSNAGLEVMGESGEHAAPSPARGYSSHEALQALLAFSALHEQIRQRQSAGRNGHEGVGDSWQLEQFVLDEVLHLVAERAVAITGADGVAIALADGDAIVCRAVVGSIAPDPGMRLDSNAGFSGACLVSGEVVRCDDSDIDTRVDPRTCQLLGTRSMVAVPLSAKQRVIGLIEAFSTEPYGFNDSDVRGLKLLAELILAALKPEEEDRLAEISQRVVAENFAAEKPAEIERSEKEEPASSQEKQEDLPPLEPAVFLSTPAPSSRPGLAVVVPLLLVAIVLGVAFWWSIRRYRTPHVVSQQSSVAAPVAKVPTPAAASESAEIPEEESPMPAPATTTAGMPQVTGIRHWSTPDSATVVIDLQDQVQYEAHRLANPERIYFDLHDTRLAASLGTRVIPVGEPLLQRIRVAQPVSGMTRVVLETSGASNFSVSLEPNPYRLVVEVRKIGVAPTPRARVDLFGPTEESAQQSEQAESPAVSTLAKQGKNPIAAKASTLRIVLDAGHGGWDLGTVGRKGLLEKDLVLDIVKRLGSLVESRMGAKVLYTRANDDYVALEKRAEIANLAKADLFLSVHANYSDFPSARGVETYYTNTYSSVRARTSEDNATLQNVNWTSVDIRAKVHQSRLLASSVQHALYGALATSNSDLPNRGVKEAQYVVLTGTSMPAILAEVSFVSSPTDENNLQSEKYRQRIAEALYQGLAHYEQARGKTANTSTVALR